MQIYGSPLYTDPNLVSYYRLEADGSDSIGSNNFTNGGVTFVPAKYGNGAYNNATGYLYVLTLKKAANASVSFWAKQSSEIGSGTRSLFAFDNAAGTQFSQINYEYNGGVRRIDFAQGNAINHNYYAVDLGTVWHNIIFIDDGTYVQGYLDGVQVVINGSKGTGGGQTSGYCTFLSGTDSYFLGTMDDLGVWNDVLTPAEIKMLSTDTQGGFFLNLI